MSRTIVQINFTTTMTKDEHDAGASQVAARLTEVPGLIWKIWLRDEEIGGAGGIYLFESAEAARAYADGPIIAMLSNRPDVSDLSVRLYGYLEGATEITRGPVGMAPFKAA